ncbi:hypothetical protein Q5425_06870 [Amycolatopsis sp. A133]|uniref:hypothetical protein n=1 Tax=Amycolatopsis sp. A133 TaxID=3064472 RepID=UPI0027EC1DAE|nr:hypothetical protein [Amycolatopsis sp. A133]MDQ7803447.1 hypothetical protein [Amycolatopsis sp. A133]
MGLRATDHADPAAAAMIGATFACVEAALASWVFDDEARPLAELLDRAMNAVCRVNDE